MTVTHAKKTATYVRVSAPCTHTFLRKNTVKYQIAYIYVVLSTVATNHIAYFFATQKYNMLRLKNKH